MKKNNQIKDIQESYPDSLIIECHELKGWARAFTEGFITFFLWCYWISLWIPLVEVLTRDCFGFNIDQNILFGFSFNSESISETSLSGFLNNLYFFLYGVVMVITCIVLWVLWNLINYKMSGVRLKLCVTIRRLLVPLKSLGKIVDKVYMCIEKIIEVHYANQIAYGCHLPETDMTKLAEKIGVHKEKLLEVQRSKRIVYFFSQNDSVSKIDLSTMCAA